MAVAYQATSESGAEVNPTWNHTPGGTPRAVLVWVSCVQGVTPSSVTYGGTAMSLIRTVDKATGETGAVHLYFLGASIPTGVATIAVSLGGDAGTAYAISLSATTDTSIVDHEGISSDSVANPSVTLSLTGRTCFAAIGARSGQNAPTGMAPLTGWTQRWERDIGNMSFGLYSYDTIGTADVTAGWTQAAEDAIAVAVAVSEVSAEAPALSWQPAFPATVPARLSLRAALVAGAFFAVFVPPAAPVTHAPPVYPDRIEKQTVEVAQQQAFFYQPSPEREPQLDWTPKYPDRLVRAPRPPEYPPLFFNPLPIPRFELGWLPRYPDRLPRARALWPQQELFVEPRAEREPDVEWTSRYPDRLPRAPRLLDPPAFFYEPSPEYEPIRDWAPIFPDLLRPAQRNPAFEVLAPFQPQVVVIYAPAVFPDQLLPARRPVLGEGLVYPFPEREPQLEWAPSYPERVPAPRRLLDPPSFFFQPFPEREAQLEWLPRYPDQLQLRRLVITQGLLAPFQPAAATNFFAAYFPDRTAPVLRAQFPEPPFVASLSTFAVPALSWGPVYPPRLDPVRRAQFPPFFPSSYPIPPAVVPDFVTSYFPAWLPPKPRLHTGGTWIQGLTALAVPELSWHPSYPDRFLAKPRQTPALDTITPRFSPPAPTLAWQPVYPARLTKPRPQLFGGAQPIWQLSGFAVPPLTWQPVYPDRYRLLRGLWVHEQQPTAFVNIVPPPGPTMHCMAVTLVVSLTPVNTVSSITPVSTALPLLGVNTVSSLTPGNVLVSLSPANTVVTGC